jgi:release factor glutamine methyltransferase
MPLPPEPLLRQPSAHQSLTARLRAAGCVFAEEEALLLIGAAPTPEALEAMIGRRVAGLPLEHILGWAEFCGLRIAVATGVFVPRRRTEFLVRQAAVLLDAWRRETGGATQPAPVVVDLCCGSGAVGAALAAHSGAVELHGADVDPAAVRCARSNVEPLGGQVHEGDLYDPLPPELRGRVRLLAVNAPYVPSAQIETMPQEARLHEPRVCLDGGGDGLDVQRRVGAGAPRWVGPGGPVLLVTTRRPASGTAAILRRHGLTPRVLRSEALGATVVAGLLESPA